MLFTFRSLDDSHAVPCRTSWLFKPHKLVLTQPRGVGVCIQTVPKDCSLYGRPATDPTVLVAYVHEAHEAVALKVDMFKVGELHGAGLQASSAQSSVAPAVDRNGPRVLQVASWVEQGRQRPRVAHGYLQVTHWQVANNGDLCVGCTTSSEGFWEILGRHCAGIQSRQQIQPDT